MLNWPVYVAIGVSVTLTGTLVLRILASKFKWKPDDDNRIGIVAGLILGGVLWPLTLVILVFIILTVILGGVCWVLNRLIFGRAVVESEEPEEPEEDDLYTSSLSPDDVPEPKPEPVPEPKPEPEPELELLPAVELPRRRRRP